MSNEHERGADAAKPEGYLFELAKAKRVDTGEYCNWGKPQFSFEEPHVPEGSIRNFRPVYSAHVSPGEVVKVKPITLKVIRSYFAAIDAGDVPDPALALYSYLLMDGYIDKRAAAFEVRSAISQHKAGDNAEVVGHQEWCQPGDIRKRQFLVTFDDPDCTHSVFENEAEARTFWEEMCINWNCYLFGALPRASRPMVVGKGGDNPSPLPQTGVIDRPARVGSVVFREGVSIPTVIEAAKRLYAADAPLHTEKEGSSNG